MLNMERKLHSHGFSCSYDDLQRFTTHVAKDEIIKIKSGVYVPSGIVGHDKGGSLVQEADDNIDVNNEMVDGKNNFHSLVGVVFHKTSAVTMPSRKIKVIKGSSRSLSLEEIKESKLTGVVYFEKPGHRVEPPRQEDALGKMKSSCDI